MRLSSVVENTATFSSEFWAEHGFSVLIEHEDSKILLDTGKSPEVLERNMGLINGFNDLETVVLSHGHGDHTGGLPAIFRNCSADIFMHNAGLKPKYISENSEMKFIGTPEKYHSEDGEISLTHPRSPVKFVENPVEIAPNIYIFTDIPMLNDFEQLNPSLLCLDDGNFVQDPFNEELVVVVRTDHGLVIVSGCAHRGIINTITAVSNYFHENICGVVGGTHLVTADENRRLRTVQEFEKINPSKLVLGHCTGFETQCLFKNKFKEVFQPLECGKMLMF
ncbi:MAG: MBL fold metallo-hydrolase [Methanobacterium sp. ERen5]|nr:MAG: MBL fold metallo-hydrolase [Methanobacterium sp. ERen5]